MIETFFVGMGVTLFVIFPLMGLLLSALDAWHDRRARGFAPTRVSVQAEDCQQPW